MGENRLFWPQEMFDEWVVEEKVTIDGDILRLCESGRRYRISQAVYFEADVGGGGDQQGFVGRVKESSTLAELGAEQYMDSVLLGDSAYKVTPGFTGVPFVEDSPATKGADDTVAKNEDRELLARFLLDNL
jgi:hypothetical protein